MYDGLISKRTLIRGVWMEVEIDERKFRKIKYHRSYLVGVW